MNANRFIRDGLATRTTITIAAKRVFRPQMQMLYPVVHGGDGAPSLRLRRRFHSSSSSSLAGRLSTPSASCFKTNGIHSSSSSSSSSSNPTLQGPAGGASFLQGLDIHTVQAEDDGHPLAVYTIRQPDNEINSETGNGSSENNKTPVLLLHGRTWSSLPVYHLIGETEQTGACIESATEDDDNLENNRSLLQALYNTQHIQPYAMDFRGFGGTPRSSSDPFVDPLRCVSDAVSVLNWIRVRHHEGQKGGEDEGGPATTRPALLGWSHGALIAQITAQRHAELVSKLIL